jgi:hypothetical protein
VNPLSAFDDVGIVTPGVGRVLQGYGLDAIPEAHCYLSDGRYRIDATTTASLMSPVPRLFLREEVIGPDQVGEYKRTVHQAFLADWLARKRLGDDWTIERLWRVREECITALSEDAA